MPPPPVCPARRLAASLDLKSEFLLNRKKRPQWKHPPSPECTAGPAALQHWGCWRPSSRLPCSGRPGRRWAWPFGSGRLSASQKGPARSRGPWRGQPSLLQPGTSGGLRCGCPSSPGTPALLPGCSWTHCRGGRRGRVRGKPLSLACFGKARQSLFGPPVPPPRAGLLLPSPAEPPHLTDSSERALMTIVRARSTWAAAVTRLKAVTRSWGFTKAAACSPRVILPEELFSTEPWQPVKRKRKRKERQGQQRRNPTAALQAPRPAYKGRESKSPRWCEGSSRPLLLHRCLTSLPPFCGTTFVWLPWISLPESLVPGLHS